MKKDTRISFLLKNNSTKNIEPRAPKIHKKYNNTTDAILLVIKEIQTGISVNC